MSVTVSETAGKNITYNKPSEALRKKWIIPKSLCCTDSDFSFKSALSIIQQDQRWLPESVEGDLFTYIAKTSGINLQK